MPNKLSTIGVEEEYLLVNSSDYSQGQLPPKMLQKLMQNNPRLDPEVFTSHLESRTNVCNSFQQLLSEVKISRTEAQSLASEFGLSICSSGTVPNYNWRKVKSLEIPRIQEMVGDFSDTFLSQSIAALHMHTKAEGLEKSLDIVNKLNWFVPIFLALSGSSRHYDGRNTGISSRRVSLIGQTQRTGFSPYFQSIDDYLQAQKALSISGWEENKFWYYLRFNPKHETIEIRIMDAVPDVKDVTALAALFLSLANAIEQNLITPNTRSAYNRVLMQINLERAMCFGTMPYTSVGREVLFFDQNLEEKPLKIIVSELVTSLHDIAADLGCSKELERVNLIANKGNSSQKQLLIPNCNELTNITKHLVQETLFF